MQSSAPVFTSCRKLLHSNHRLSIFYQHKAQFNNTNNQYPSPFHRNVTRQRLVLPSAHIRQSSTLMVRRCLYSWTCWFRRYRPIAHLSGWSLRSWLFVANCTSYYIAAPMEIRKRVVSSANMDSTCRDRLSGSMLRLWDGRRRGKLDGNG